MKNYNFNSNINQTIKEKFVENNVITCMSPYVDYILQTTYGLIENYNNAPFNYDDIENMYIDNSKEIEEIEKKIEELETNNKEKIEELEEEKIRLEEEQEEPQEVYEWWQVSPYLLNELRKRGEVVIPHVNLWGRCTTGQAILLDSVISNICYNMEILEGQKYSWE